ncbi:hypothetical protein ACLECU_16430, partial [Lonsdalea quercina]|uniref:hypothetical protein n=1 Tax=Lonsdalea quercina TaxID=71657 RepID=UPI003975D958
SSLNSGVNRGVPICSSYAQTIGQDRLPGRGQSNEPNLGKSAGNTSSFDANEIRFSQNTVSYNKTDRDTGVKYNYDDLVSSMKKMVGKVILLMLSR